MNKKGFTLVELLAVIAILGAISVITITAVSRYISSSRKEKVSQSKKNVAMATELYIQANRDFAPKAIGESTIIPLSTLKNKNYIKENLTNEAGEDCMEKSFVRVYKLSIEEYSYTTFLYCGNDTVPSELEVPEPVVFDFLFSGGNKDASGKFTSIKDAKFSFKMKGARNDATVGIYSYSYSIYVAKNVDDSRVDYVEVYNSGSIKGNYQPAIAITDRSLSDYIDVAGITDIRVDVTVINEQGGKTEYSTASSGENGSYGDSDKPICGSVDGDAKDINDWINKDTFGANGTILAGQKRSYPAHISVGCSDNNGSGCKRDRFSKTWPNDGKSDSGVVNYKYGATWSYIEIEDNAKTANKTKCYVRVNMDLQAPTLTIDVHKANADGTLGDKVYSTTVKDSSTVNANILQKTIKADAYDNLVGVDNEKWMNKENYPNGIIIKISASDNIGLKTWKFEANKPNIKSGANEGTIVNSGFGFENALGEGNFLVSGQFEFDDATLNLIPKNESELSRVEKYNTQDNLPNLVIKRNGMRYGKITVCDYAGNCSVLNIFANIDITDPSMPIINYYKETSGSIYTPANVDTYQGNDNWSTEFIKVVASNDGTSISGVDHYEYSYRRQKGKSGNGRYNWYDAVTGELLASNEQAGHLISDQGRHIFQMKACSRAGNCSSLSDEDYIMIDTIKPVCHIKTDYEELADGKYTRVAVGPSGWLKSGQRAKISHTCSDNAEYGGGDDVVDSGCNIDSAYNKQQFVFDFDIDTENAGANGYDNHTEGTDPTVGGHVVDYAGNISDECPKTSIRIDSTPPACTTTISYPEGEPINQSNPLLLETGWLGMSGNTKKTAVVGKKCDDERTANGIVANVSSGCDDDGMYDANNYNSQTFTYKSEMVIENAGAGGVGNGGKVIDIAGNVTNCPANRTVKIDYKAPTCSLHVGYGVGQNASSYVRDNSIEETLVDGWLGYASDDNTLKRMAKVSQVCKDTGTSSSGCEESSVSKIYDQEMNSTEVGAMGVGVIGTVRDKAGNIGNCTPNKTVKIDYTRPVCEVTASSSGSVSSRGRTYDWTYDNYDGRWLGKNAKVNIKSTCSSAESGTGNSSGCKTNKTKKYEGEMKTDEATTGGIGVNFYVYDKANNRSAQPCTPKEIKIDITAPLCSVSATYNNNAYNGEWVKGDKPVVVTSKCVGDKLADGQAGSGCDTDDGIHNFTAEEDDILNVEGGSGSSGGAYAVYDAVGNKKACGKKIIKIDNQKPDCFVTSSFSSSGATYSGSWTNEAIIVKAKCEDYSGSGCATSSRTYTYNPNAGNIINTTTAGAGGDNVDVYVKDKVGNQELCSKNKKIRIDKQPPSCTIIERPSNEAANPPQYLKTECSDGSGSGCKSPKTDLLTFAEYGEWLNQTYSHAYEDKVGNIGNCTTTYNVINRNSAFDEVSCTFRVDYTKNGASTNRSLISVQLPSGITVKSYNNRGVNKATATESDSPVNCGTQYSGSVTVTDGRTDKTYSCGSKTTVSCCSSVEWRDGDKNGNKTCSVTCLSGTYNISDFSTLNGQYCDHTKTSGGSNCEVPCKVYICRKDFDHGRPDNWTRYFSWIFLIDSKGINLPTGNNGRYAGYSIGQNSSLYVQRTIYQNGYSNPHWIVQDNSCAGDSEKHNPKHSLCSGGICPGWDVACHGRTSDSKAAIYSGCIRTSPVGYDTDCANTCKG